MDIFHSFVYVPIFNLLIVLYRLFSGNLGLAIIGIALIAKLVTYPLTRRQVASAEKSREFQRKTSEIKAKYKNDQEKMAKEMARVQAEFLPGQLGGCLNLILVIVLLVQVRGVLVNLVTQGVHSFNEVAYTEGLKFPEDSVTISIPKDTSYAIHDLVYTVPASNGSVLKQTLKIAFAENTDQQGKLRDEIKNYNNNLSDTDKQAQQQATDAARAANIGLFITEFQSDTVTVGLPSQLTAYLRPPSNETINYDALVVTFDGKEVKGDALKYSQGKGMNLLFLGADLSRVATDVGFSNLTAVFPYILIAVLVGITQFFSTQIQAGFGPMSAKPEDKADDKKKDKKKTKDEPDFAELMTQSSKQMMFIFPVITILMSIGYLGGAQLFPSGVSLFWTGQNSFVIIEQLITHRTKVIAAVKLKINNLRKNKTPWTTPISSK